MMYVFEFDAVGQGSLYFGRKPQSEKASDETHAQHEERTWREKMYTNERGEVVLQPFALKLALVSAGKWLSMGIPGEGKKKYTTRFRQGVRVINWLEVVDSNGRPHLADEVACEKLFLEQRAKTRVDRIFPRIDDWVVKCSGVVLDDIISEEVLEKHLVAAGQFVGFGSLRVENGGSAGSFLIDGLKTQTITLDEMVAV